MADEGLSTLLRELRSRVPVDAAELLAQEPPDRIEAALRALPPDFAARVAAQLPGAMQADAEDAEAEVPGHVLEIMEPARGVLRMDLCAADAVAWLSHAGDVSDVTYLYVVDEAEVLHGIVVMRDLLLARPAQTLAEVMLRNPYILRREMPMGDAVKAAIKRHYPVYPVCDEEGRLLGQVRGWRLFERQAIEIAAQSGRMVGLDKTERISTGLWESFRMRHPWLQLNLVTAFAAGFVVSLFEDTISQIVALAAFLPILAGQSGNNGCQTLAITLRGLTLGELEDFPIRSLVRKEVLLGALNGFFTGLIAALAMWWSAGGTSNPQALPLALVILLAMTGSCMASGLFGVMVPLTLRRFGADPATASSIFLTTGTDIAGMGLMLFLATAVVL